MKNRFSRWHGHEELSKGEKPVMIFYASPPGYKYGFFTSTSKARQQEFLAEMEPVNQAWGYTSRECVRNSNVPQCLRCIYRNDCRARLV